MKRSGTTLPRVPGKRTPTRARGEDMEGKAKEEEEATTTIAPMEEDHRSDDDKHEENEIVDVDGSDEDSPQHSRMETHVACARRALPPSSSPAEDQGWTIQRKEEEGKHHQEQVSRTTSLSSHQPS
ncbi:hypothetical protein E2C01_039368 [Portunus trituberculatus]|uniref:Uncharacterized protein n=1 Tax=Portunus trituberculatus TaxID=210409 RepID=A0A5B7FKI8_PORTR|nr:hypothetical protein [Portunus trituberculatus]